MEKMRRREVDETGGERSDESLSRFAKIAADNINSNIAKQQSKEKAVNREAAMREAAGNINANVKEKKRK